MHGHGPSLAAAARDVLAASALVFLNPVEPALAGCVDKSNPSFTVRRCENVGLGSDGRLKKCEANSNCLSTSSVSSPEHFGRPWTFRLGVSDSPLTGRDVRVAWNELKDVVSNTEDLTLLEADDKRLYLRATGPSVVPPGARDVLEFDVREDGVVFYKLESEETVFVYPVQRPIGTRGGGNHAGGPASEVARSPAAVSCVQAATIVTASDCRLSGTGWVGTCWPRERTTPPRRRQTLARW